MASSSDPDRPGRRWFLPLVAGLIALAALWPAALNGGPFFMADTPSYARGAASGFFKAFGLKTEWTDEYFRVYAGSRAGAPQPADDEAEAADATGQIPVTLSGRSIFYGVVLYLAHLIGSLWIIVLLQGLLAAGCIVLTVHTISRVVGTRMRASGLIMIGLLLVAATPLAFFAGYLMPDIFGGFALLATANILFLWRNLSRTERAFWLALLAYSLLVHSVNLMMVSGLTVISIAFAWWRRIVLSRYQLGGLVACLAIAVLGQAAFGLAVKSMTGAAPVRPPFIAMRLIADGPGYTYLKENCSTDHYIYCRVLGQLDPKSDTLLWSKDERTSLFRGLSPDEQRMSSAQQSRFVNAVLSDRPGEVIGGAIGNSVRQIFQLDLNGFNYSRENRGRFRNTIPADLFEPLSQTRAYRSVMPTRPTEVLSALTAVLSILCLAFFVAFARSSDAMDRLRAYCLCVLAGIALNAFICGALSGPKGRYEMRVIWVLPLIAGAIVSTGSANWRRRSVTSPEALPEVA
jgi:hypothetical protein